MQMLSSDARIPVPRRSDVACVRKEGEPRPVMLQLKARRFLGLSVLVLIQCSCNLQNSKNTPIRQIELNKNQIEK